MTRVAPALLYELIRRFEGCRLRAYLCPAGVWTCGFGSTGPDVVEGVTWTLEYAVARMKVDAEKFARGACALSPRLTSRPAARSAVSDFCYNLGLTRYKGSTLRKRVNAGDWPGACQELRKWTRGGGRVLAGLVLRREAEVKLIQGET